VVGCSSLRATNEPGARPDPDQLRSLINRCDIDCRGEVALSNGFIGPDREDASLPVQDAMPAVLNASEAPSTIDLF
jgi:hypothetical protein